MKTKNIILVIIAAAFFSAQQAAAQAMTSKEDSIRLINTSLFQEYVKSENYADAVKPWQIVYENFPASTAFTYAYGARILAWQISQAKTPEERKELIEKLMKLYDDRITYFGTNQRQPTPWILGMKALDYINYHPEDVLKKSAYEWFGAAISGLGENSELAFIQQFLYLSNNLYFSDKSHAEQFIQDYLKVSDITAAKIKNAANDTQRQQAELVKQGNDALFAASGAADCDMLEKIYSKDLEANKDNIEWLNNTLGFFKKLRCIESPTYFKASVFAHKITPTAESAAGIAEMSYLNNEYSKAISFFEEAVSLAEDRADKAEFQYKIAQIYFNKLNNFPRTREFARAAIANRPNWGEPYILIAMAYANSKNIFGDDAILNSTVFWAAVDQLEKAKQVDQSISARVNPYITSYRANFPKKEDVFFKPELEPGKPFIVGGWINETVTSR